MAEDPARPIRPEFVDAIPPPPRPEGSRLLAYLQLIRAPNVFTALADVAMGYLITTRSIAAWPSFLLLLAASALLYTAGMVLNDVFDVAVDRLERPRRPLPSGRISLEWARLLGLGLLLGGVVCGWLAGWSATLLLSPPWRSGVVATALAGTVLAYNAWAKHTPLGPLVMGSCRFLNVLLGMSLNAAVTTGEATWLGYGASHFLVAAGIGLYIVGVTYFARHEAAESPRAGLAVGLAIMILGIGVLAFVPRWYPESFAYRYEPTLTWPLAVLMLSIWILRRPMLALLQPDSRQVQAAVKHCILSLIVLDATVTTLVAPWPYGVAIVGLLLPTLWLARWVYST